MILLTKSTTDEHRKSEFDKRFNPVNKWQTVQSDGTKENADDGSKSAADEHHESEGEQRFSPVNIKRKTVV